MKGEMNSMFTELDLKEIRNNISLTEKGMFDVSSIYISFLNPTSFENLKSEIIEFHSLTEGLQDLIIKNFKKVFLLKLFLCQSFMTASSLCPFT